MRIDMSDLKLNPPPNHDFMMGERVRDLDTGDVGKVAHLPQATLPFGRDFSGCLGVDMPNGSRVFAPVDRWEKA